MHTSTSIIIGSTTVHQDANGRYSLNDLHRAAGGEDKHRPTFFLRLESTDALCAVLRGENPHIAPVEVVRGGMVQGSFAVRELVYAYAMWVGPAFYLRVIRTFDALATGHVTATPARPLPATYLEALKALVVAEEERERLALETDQRQLAEQALKVTEHLFIPGPAGHEAECGVIVPDVAYGEIVGTTCGYRADEHVSVDRPLDPGAAEDASQVA